MAKPGTAKSATKKAAAGEKPGRAAAARAAEPEVPEMVGSEKEYLRFVPVAEEVEARDIVPYRIDAALVHHNVCDGLESIRAERARIEAELPAARLHELEELPDLALALEYSAHQAAGAAPASEDLPRLLAEASELRDPMLASADALAKAKVIPQAPVERIKKGRGPRDRAQDCIDLSSLFRTHAAAVRGKTAITKTQVERAAVVGTQLLKLLKPKGARKRKPGDQAALADRRDRLNTVIDARHERMRRIGVWLWGEDGVDDHVPALGSRRRTKSTRTAKKPTADTADKPAKEPKPK